MHLIRHTAFILFIISLTIFSQAKERRPPQQHNPNLCNENVQCLTLWYFEYKGAILDEVLFWREFENDVADRNVNGSLNDFRLSEIEGKYRHVYWQVYRGATFQLADEPDLLTLMWSCRNAIISIKYMLIAVSENEPLTQGDPGTYLDQVRKCEHEFNLPAFTSRLRPL